MSHAAENCSQTTDSLTELLVGLRDVTVGAAPLSETSALLAACPGAVGAARELRALGLVPFSDEPAPEELLDHADCELPHEVRSRICANVPVLRAVLRWNQRAIAIAVFRAVELWLLEQLAPEPSALCIAATAPEDIADLVSDAMRLTGVEEHFVEAVEGDYYALLASPSERISSNPSRVIADDSLRNENEILEDMTDLVRLARRLSDALVEDPSRPKARTLAVLLATCVRLGRSEDARTACCVAWMGGLRALLCARRKHREPVIPETPAKSSSASSGSGALGMAAIACFPSNVSVDLGRFAVRALSLLAQIETPHSHYAALRIGLHHGVHDAETLSSRTLDFVAASLLFDLSICRSIVERLRGNAEHAFE